MSKIEALPANEGRGEVAVTIDGVDLVLAAEMEGLAFLSAQLGCRTQHELLQRIVGAELGAMFAVLNSCVVRGDAEAAKRALTLTGARALAHAMEKVLVHHAGDEPGNAGGPGGAAGASGRKRTRASPGASG